MSFLIRSDSRSRVRGWATTSKLGSCEQEEGVSELTVNASLCGSHDSPATRCIVNVVTGGEIASLSTW